MITKHYIDNSEFLELVSDLAHRVTELTVGEDLVHINRTDDVLLYTEIAQNFFNEAYSEIETRLNTAGIYSDNEKPDEIKAPIYYIYNENNINAVEIEQEIFQQELFEYTIRDREDFIGELIRWISETKSASDKFLMMQDLEMLLKRTDDYMFSSISTNKYICQGDPEFNETCKELLELNESFKNQKNESREI